MAESTPPTEAWPHSPSAQQPPLSFPFNVYRGHPSLGMPAYSWPTPRPWKILSQSRDFVQTFSTLATIHWVAPLLSPAILKLMMPALFTDGPIGSLSLSSVPSSRKSTKCWLANLQGLQVVPRNPWLCSSRTKSNPEVLCQLLPSQ